MLDFAFPGEQRICCTVKNLIYYVVFFVKIFKISGLKSLFGQLKNF